MNNRYDTWKRHLIGTSDGKAIDAMSTKETDDAFSGDIAFGTGGLRGIMGMGSNRMNRYTVERVTHGLARVILSSEPPKSVCVGFDTRHNSAEFAQIVCALLSAYGISVYAFDEPKPTPMLSHAIRYLKAGWGVVITASHNPQEYNGYKIYDYLGVQVTDKVAGEITNAILSVEYFESYPENKAVPAAAVSKDLVDAYFEQIVSFAGRSGAPGVAGMPIVYSALHGTGAAAVPEVLRALGFSPVCIEQEPDGSFGGLKTPNPEEPEVYANALAEAERCGAELVLATDPDCDRVGVMIRSERGFRPLNGNQIGALLIDYLIQTRSVVPGDTVITTIVSGLLGERVALENGLEFKRLLTGFKYIGEYVEQLPEGKRFFFGYEESYGFLAGNAARDKDAVISSALIAQMTAYHSSGGVTLLDRWHALCEEHGYCVESLQSFNIPQSSQRRIMTKLRGRPNLEGVLRIEDYLKGVDGLPLSDVIKLYFENGCWAAIRPSGTEPKIKLYAGACAESLEVAESLLGATSDLLLAELM
ncbi:MAG: phospho-sugar mutase [Oscillospiraceae bacterium]|nr:phospho-sugar mutase [Oscillospiraceae bacterium]